MGHWEEGSLGLPWLHPLVSPFDGSKSVPLGSCSLGLKSLPLSSYVTSGSLLNICELQFSYLLNVDNNNPDLLRQ